jgi:hypothetical protein
MTLLLGALLGFFILFDLVLIGWLGCIFGSTRRPRPRKSKTRASGALVP